MRESASSRRSLLAVQVCVLSICTHTHTHIHTYDNFLLYLQVDGGGGFVFLIVGNIIYYIATTKTATTMMGRLSCDINVIILLLRTYIIGGEPRLMINREPIINV